MQNDKLETPADVAGFSWAALLWGGIWAIAHRVWIGLLAFVPFFGLIMNLVLGFKGREWAWQKGSVKDPIQFNRAQRIWVIAWLIVSIIAIPLLGVASALSIYGVTKYVKNAKRAEAELALSRLSSGLLNCAKQRGSLPDSSSWVPAEPPHAAKYQSAADDWAQDPTFSCASFSISEPQYFRYRWLRSSPSSGEIQAEADLDGNGDVDSSLRQTLNCAAGSCTAEPPIANSAQ